MAPNVVGPAASFQALQGGGGEEGRRGHEEEAEEGEDEKECGKGKIKEGRKTRRNNGMGEFLVHEGVRKEGGAGCGRRR